MRIHWSISLFDLEIVISRCSLAVIKMTYLKYMVYELLHSN